MRFYVRVQSIPFKANAPLRAAQIFATMPHVEDMDSLYKPFLSSSIPVSHLLFHLVVPSLPYSEAKVSRRATVSYFEGEPLTLTPFGRRCVS